jgi:serine/threonine-protein kinase
VAFIDNNGKRLWHKPFSNNGRTPSVAAAANGDMQLGWVEDQRILTASLGREGVGPSSKVARVIGTPTAPAIAPGSKRGEWYVAFLDTEANHREPYAARIQCE